MTIRVEQRIALDFRIVAAVIRSSESSSDLVNELWPGPYWLFSAQVLNTGTGLLVQESLLSRSLPRSAVSRPTAYGTPVPEAEYVM